MTMENTKKIKWEKLLVYMAIPVIVGGLSAFLSGSGMEKYESLLKPPLSPPSFLFPVVWTILYLLMGISYYIICQESEPCKASKLLYVSQLFVNFIWSILFFHFGLLGISFLWLVLLWVLILLMIISFYRCRPIAGILQIPYLLWVTFAGYLNLYIFLLNGM